MAPGTASRRGLSREPLASRTNTGRRQRTDRDGDSAMASLSTPLSRSRDRISKSSRGGRGSDATAGFSGLVSSRRAERELMKHVAANESTLRAPRARISGSLQEVTIAGWAQSKAANEPDRGVAALIAFLERRSTMNREKWATAKGLNRANPIRIKKYRVEGDELILSLSAEEVIAILRLNGYVFAGANLKIESLRADRSQGEGARAETSSTQETKQLLRNVLSRRYNPDAKLLDLSSLAADPDLNAMGVYDAASTQSKFFPALMKICDEQFKSAEEKKETIVGVTLSRNGLSSVAPVTTVAQTFPHLKNLDLSENEFKELASLEAWRHKFRHLDHLILAGNAIETAQPDYVAQLTKWYPTLRLLNGMVVRSPEEAAQGQTKSSKQHLPVRGPIFQDEGQIAESFVKVFFLGFDNDRRALVKHYYDEHSAVSLSVNVSALRDQSASQEMKSQQWEAYIRRSRNLKKITLLPARMSRSYTGVEAIIDLFTSLPASKHADPIANPEKWLVECTTQPGVPDPTGQSTSGVGGFLITVHGEFEETGNASAQSRGLLRSFDRTFVLGPGGPNGVRVVTDLWTLRAFGGNAAFRPETSAPDSSLAIPPPDLPNHDPIIAELSRLSGMNLPYSRQCLEESGWDPMKALAAFEAAKTLLPPEAFL